MLARDRGYTDTWADIVSGGSDLTLYLVFWILGGSAQPKFPFREVLPYLAFVFFGLCIDTFKNPDFRIMFTFIWILISLLFIFMMIRL